VLTGFIEAKDDGGGGDNWSYKTCKAPVKMSPPTNQHPTFYRPDALPCRQTNSVKALEGNICLLIVDEKSDMGQGSCAQFP